MLQADNITKVYRKKTVLSNVSFSLRNGECLGLAGHNGSGKSTLLSIVAQALAPDAGTITCDGKNVLGDKAFLRASLGYAPQQNALLDDLSVIETLKFWQKAYAMPSQNLFAPDLPCCLMGLEELKKKKVSALSGGMKKRLSVAIAMMHSPLYILLDEVLPALDQRYRKALLDWIQSQKKRGAAVLYCSHEIEEIRRMCDTVLILRDGQTAFFGPAQELPSDLDGLDALLNPLTSGFSEVSQ